MDPVEWGKQFKRLAEVRGVKVGSKGGRPRKDENPANVAGLAAELGVPQRTAERRIQAANLPEPEQAAIKEGRKTVSSALRDNRRKAKERQAAPALSNV
jgi:hypothetical protein